MRNISQLVITIGVVGTLLTGCTQGGSNMRGSSVYYPAHASAREILAAKEVGRYIYLRTGQLLPLVETAELPAHARGVAVSRDDRHSFVKPAKEKLAGYLPPGGFRLIAVDSDIPAEKARLLLIAGGDDSGVLYGAYRFAETLGVRFYLHDDVIPDTLIPFQIPDMDEQRAPLFALRGIQPFHDFPEGPDWWNADDYKAILAQLPKLGMNFIGLHTYPEDNPVAEPTVWIGPKDELDSKGTPTQSYASSYQNTLRGKWGYAAKVTSQFSYGAAELFDRDAFGPDLMDGQCPAPTTPEGAIAVFDRTAHMLRDAFTFAHQLGIKTCVGTETPLTIPKALQDRLKAKGLDAKDLSVTGSLYEGMFTRIMRAYPVDYFWFWTPEGWTWSGTTQKDVQATYADIKAAIAAAENVHAPFKLATCGWVLGPQYDRAEFDRILPKNMAMSCINRQVGMTPVEPGFAAVTGRDKWAIPWMEDDPGLTSPQLWVGRMRRDAVDARQYGCTGLMGIHWRTRALAPNVLALARAAWDQSGFDSTELQPTGPLGGSVVDYPNNKIEGTDDDALYQTVRYDVRGYHLRVPPGQYKVTLKFCEPCYEKPGVRVFDVSIGGKSVIQELDIFAKAGQNHALDYTFEKVEPHHGLIDIDFGYRVEYPCIAAIAIEGAGYTRKINCGGPACKDYEADPPAASDHLPCGDFYKDWATAEFGTEKGPVIAAIFEKLDGKLPRTSDWVDGPGGIRPDPRSWAQVEKEFAFVDELAGLRPTGRGEADRFDYWLSTFQYMRSIGQLRCVFGEYTAAMKQVKDLKDPAEQKRLVETAVLPIRKRIIEGLAPVYANLLRHVSNPGELGTVSNWDQHVQDIVLTQPGQELEKILGEPLPESLRHPPMAAPSPHPARIIVPTLRTSIVAGEGLTLRVMVLNADAPTVTLHWRPLGPGEFKSVAAQHVARAVYSVKLPTQAVDADFEYYIEASFGGAGETLRFPATAPELCRTVVVMPAAR